MINHMIFNECLKNLENDTTWFYLNKQATFVKKMAIK